MFFSYPKKTKATVRPPRTHQSITSGDVTSNYRPFPGQVKAKLQKSTKKGQYQPILRYFIGYLRITHSIRLCFIAPPNIIVFLLKTSLKPWSKNDDTLLCLNVWFNWSEFSFNTIFSIKSTSNMGELFVTNISYNNYFLYFRHRMDNHCWILAFH